VVRRKLGIHQRLAALAEHVRESEYYECTWDLFRIAHFKGVDEKGAARALTAWARGERFNIMFEVRRVREIEVLYVLLRPKGA